MTRIKTHRDFNGGHDSGSPPLFNPSHTEAELYDSLAEEQAERIEHINSSQLRRFFGETKELYRRFNSLTAHLHDDAKRAEVYHRQIEPMFKMMRSKVNYAKRAGGQSRIPDDFANFIAEGVAQVNNKDDFRKFVTHFEAVVGFLYGKGKVRK